MDKCILLSHSKQILLASVLFGVFGCTSLWEDYDQKVHENKEFDKEVQIKEIDPPVASAGAEVAVQVKDPEDANMLKNQKKTPSKKEKSGKNKTEDKSSALTATAKDAPAVSIKHLPAIEDSEGFIGRRPEVDPFVVGETLEFTVRYFKLEGGRFTMTTKPMVEVNGKKSYHFAYQARSSSVFSVFYAVDDRADTYVDYEDLVPYSYIISAKESKQVRDVKSYINHKTRKAKTWDKKIKKGKDPEIKEYEWDTDAYAQNVFSIAYYLRCFKLAVGKKLAVNVAHEGKNIIMRADVVRTEKLSTPMGKLDTFVVKPSFEIDGVFKPVGDVYMWVTNDQYKRLVRIEAKIKIGTVVAAIEKITP